jgi:hypothetical protein
MRLTQGVLRDNTVRTHTQHGAAHDSMVQHTTAWRSSDHIVGQCIIDAPHTGRPVYEPSTNTHTQGKAQHGTAPVTCGQHQSHDFMQEDHFMRSILQHTG